MIHCGATHFSQNPPVKAGSGRDEVFILFSRFCEKRQTEVSPGALSTHISHKWQPGDPSEPVFSGGNAVTYGLLGILVTRARPQLPSPCKVSTPLLPGLAEFLLPRRVLGTEGRPPLAPRRPQQVWGGGCGRQAAGRGMLSSGCPCLAWQLLLLSQKSCSRRNARNPAL